MNITLYEYGLDEKLKEAVELLKSAKTKSSKYAKDNLISEVIGIIDTVRFMVDVHEPEQAADTGDK